MSKRKNTLSKAALDCALKKKKFQTTHSDGDKSEKEQRLIFVNVLQEPLVFWGFHAKQKQLFAFDAYV